MVFTFFTPSSLLFIIKIYIFLACASTISATTTSYYPAGISTINANGTILSTNALGSSTYTNYANCTWLVASPGSIPVLTVTRFSTEATYDFFSVYGSNNIATLFLTTNALGASTYASFPNYKWLIRRAEFNAVLTIHSFVTESGFDYFTAYNGITSASPILHYQAGDLTVPVTFWANNANSSLWVTFTDDGTGQASGVTALVTFVNTYQCPLNSNGQSLQAGCVCHAGFNCTIIAASQTSYTEAFVYANCPAQSPGTTTSCACNAVPESVITVTMVNGLPSYTGICAVAMVLCSNINTIINVSNTMISTNPNSSITYLNNSNCAWLIRSPTFEYTPVLTIHKFSEGSYDYFSVYNGINASAPQLFRQSGTGVSVPLVITLTSNNGIIAVTFTSDAIAHDYTGVIATGTFVAGPCPPNSLNIHGISALAGCTCNTGFTGSIVASNSFYSGSCMYANYPAQSTGTISGCACNNGWTLISVSIVNGLHSYTGSCTSDAVDAVVRCGANNNININNTILTTYAQGAKTYITNANRSWLIRSAGFNAVLNIISSNTEGVHNRFTVFDCMSAASPILLALESKNLTVFTTFRAKNDNMCLFVTFKNDGANLQNYGNFGVIALVTFSTASQCSRVSIGQSLQAGYVCNTGLMGSIIATSQTFYSGACVYAGCPSLSTATATGCTCNSGIQGMVNGIPSYTGYDYFSATNVDGSFFVTFTSGLINQAAGVTALVTFVPGTCRPNSNGASVLAGCTCNAGFNGTVICKQVTIILCTISYCVASLKAHVYTPAYKGPTVTFRAAISGYANISHAALIGCFFGVCDYQARY